MKDEARARRAILSRDRARTVRERACPPPEPDPPQPDPVVASTPPPQEDR
jgi:hypothetical protein